MRKIGIALIGLLGVALWGVAPTARGDASSTNYQIKFDSFSFTDDLDASSASYNLRSSTDTVIGQGTSSSYELGQGFGFGIYDRVASFELGIQDYSTQTAVTAQPGTNTYTVASASGYSQGQIVLIISNESDDTPTYRIGPISGISSNDITVSIADVDPDYDALTIDGVDDYMYELNYGSGSLDFSLLSSSTVSKRHLVPIVRSENDERFSLYIREDQDFTGSGTGQTISDVTDGEVTAGSSEYGGRASDTSLSESTFDTEDAAITSTLQQIGSVGAAGDSYQMGIFTIKAAISSTQVQDTYSHTLTVVYVGDF